MCQGETGLRPKVVVDLLVTDVCVVRLREICWSHCWTCLSQVFVVSDSLRFVGVIVGCACHRCLWCQIA